MGAPDAHGIVLGPMTTPAKLLVLAALTVHLAPLLFLLLVVLAAAVPVVLAGSA